MTTATMSAEQFRAALRDLGLTQQQAAELLGTGGGQARVSDWCRGKLAVPGYISAHMRSLLFLQQCPPPKQQQKRKR